MNCPNSKRIEDHMSIKIEISLLKDPIMSDPGTPEAWVSLLKDPEMSDLGPPEAWDSNSLDVSFLKRHLEIGNFHLSKSRFLDPGQSTFTQALYFMFHLFNEGWGAEEITLLFNNKNNDFSISFVSQVVGSDFPTTIMDQLNSIQQLEVDGQVRLDIAIFELLLRLNCVGKSLPGIQKELENHGYYLRKEFIEEMVKYENLWNSRMLIN